jgi:hypothetical protein
MMPSTVKGPAIFLAQFAGDSAPFNSWKAICGWAAGLGYKGVQIPTWDGRLFDLAKAAASKGYCDEVSGIAREHGIAREADSGLEPKMLRSLGGHVQLLNGPCLPLLRLAVN